METTMPTVNRTIRVRRAVAFAIALIVPTIFAIATTAYADNESAAAIEPPYRAVMNETAQSGSGLPAPNTKSDASAGSRQQNERARDIYKPGVSDR
jgi:hypothetical protein